MVSLLCHLHFWTLKALSPGTATGISVMIIVSLKFIYTHTHCHVYNQILNNVYTMLCVCVCVFQVVTLVLIHTMRRRPVRSKKVTWTLAGENGLKACQHQIRNY